MWHRRWRDSKLACRESLLDVKTQAAYLISTPVVLRLGGFRVYVLLPPREHGPAHVHVKNADGSCVIELATLIVKKRRKMRDPDVVAAVWLVADRMAELLTAWSKYHG